MNTDLVAPIGMSLLLIASALVSGSETALFSLRPAEVEQMARQPGHGNQLVTWLIERSQRLLLAILLANNAVNITYFAITGWWAGSHSDPIEASLIGFGSLVAIILCGEIMPKVTASSDPTLFARLLAPLLYGLVLVLGPICSLVERLFPFVRNTATRDASESITDEELKLVIAESHRRGVVSELAHDRLLEIIDLSTTPVYQVMSHRVDCATVPVDADEDGMREALREKQQPFMLVIDDEHNEDCIGLLTAQDVLRGGKVRQRMRKPLYIPNHLLLPQAINLFQTNNVSFGVVVDEYGGTAGLLTLSHIGKALLGEGRSEDLPTVDEPEQIDEHSWRISGQMPLEDWQAVMREEDTSGCTTIGGFVTRNLGSVPEVDDRILYRNLEFRVTTVENHRIGSLVVKQLPVDEVRRMSTEERLR